MVYAYKVVVVVPLLFLALLVLVTSSPLQVVSIDGICKSSSVIGNFVVSQALGKTSSPCPVAAAFDCASETDGYSVLNSILETSFSPNSKGKVIVNVIFHVSFMFKCPLSFGLK